MTDSTTREECAQSHLTVSLSHGPTASAEQSESKLASRSDAASLDRFTPKLATTEVPLRVYLRSERS